MEVTDLIQRGCMLQAAYDVDLNTDFVYETETSPEYCINGVVIFQLKVVIVKIRHQQYHILLLIKFAKKNRNTQEFIYKFSSNKLEISEMRFKSDETDWRLVHETDWRVVHDTQSCYSFTFDVSVSLEVIDNPGSFSVLRNDKELIDFTLEGEDGSVKVHKAVLAVSSPVFRQMLEGDWKEKNEGTVSVPGTSKCVLQQFKDYLYLKKLPDSGLEHLLLLASYYMMSEFEQKCIDKLMSTVNAQNALHLSEFAVQHKMTKLHLAILECFECGIVRVAQIKEMSSSSKRSLEDDESSVKKQKYTKLSKKKS